MDIIVARLGSFEVRMDGQKISVACSIGRAHYQVNDTPESILRRADEVLYAQKAGRGRHKGQSPETLLKAGPSTYSGEPQSFVPE